MNWTTLVSAEDLSAHLGEADLVPVDCRFVMLGADPEAGELAWRRSHLPGAGYAHLNRHLSDLRKPASEGRHPLPDEEAFLAVLARLNIGPRSQVVAYDAGDGSMAAARLWWLLRLLGHRRVAVLDGGFARWQALGLPLTDQPPADGQGRYPGRFDLAQLVTVAEVQACADGRRGRLLDARAGERFRGEVEPIDAVAGHIPGARNRPLADNLREGRFKSPAELRAELTALLDGRSPRETIVYCGSGVTACHDLLALEHAGLEGARVFAPSWSGWISDRSRPIATGEA